MTATDAIRAQCNQHFYDLLQAGMSVDRAEATLRKQTRDCIHILDSADMHKAETHFEAENSAITDITDLYRSLEEITL